MSQLKLSIWMLAITISFATVSGFGSSEDKFMKKYAMMKIYESCFGQEVVKQIRKEMKAACQKCASYDQPIIPLQQPQSQPSLPPQQQPVPVIPQRPTTTFEQHKEIINTLGQVADPDNTAFANQQTFDADKLQQAILSYRPLNNPYNVAQFRPYQQPNYYNSYQSPLQGPYIYPNFQQQAGSYQQYPQQSFGHYPSFYTPQFYGNNRISRELDIRSQIEALTSRTSGKVRNVTCVMQELGYLDANLEPSYDKIVERIERLPVAEELKRDMRDGVFFCQQFSQCVPDIKRDRSPLSRELVKPMFFFKCYKHKKLEACIMKDVREKFTEVSEEDFDGDVEFRRTSRSVKSEPEQLAKEMFEFLYASDSNVDMESFF